MRGQKVTGSQDRYGARPATVPGCFLLWDELSKSAVYGTQLLGKTAVEAHAQRLNKIYRQFLKDGAATPEKPPHPARRATTHPDPANRSSASHLTSV